MIMMTMGNKQSIPSAVPTGLTVRTQSRVLEITFKDHAFSLPFEFLRVYSPSAEVRGHGAGQETLQTGMRKVSIASLEQVGNYAVQPIFTDGHNTGIYSWDYLYWLGVNQDALWEDYLGRLEAAGFSRDGGRDALMSTAGQTGKSCGHQH
ncbi:MAG: DUF971 domain-containing protein [Burkholderiaceae bacterium]